jgi:hypothetical protein
MDGRAPGRGVREVGNWGRGGTGGMFPRERWVDSGVRGATADDADDNDGLTDR